MIPTHETRTLAWPDAARWKEFVRELERDAGDGRWVGFISYEALASEEDVLPRDAHPPEPAACFSWHERPIVPHAMHAPGSSHRATIRDSLEGGAHARLVERIR